MQLNRTHKEWLINRGISESVLNKFNIQSELSKIVIPVNNSFNKYRRDPFSEDGPKYTYSKGSKVSLFNLKILNQVDSIIICEGELDVLRLESEGLHAVTSTGGATSFQEDWIPLFKDKEVFVCLDNDSAGRLGTIRICSMIPTAKVISLPDSLGEHSDVTDFFQEYNINDFKLLMKVASPLDIKPKEDEPMKVKKIYKNGNKIEQAKSIPLESILRFNSVGKATCPFHTDKTPSLQKYKNNSWHCFSCSAGRDTIDLIMKMHNLSFNDAIDYLLK